MTSPDTIELRGLEVWCRIGVPEWERTAPQRIFVDALWVPTEPFTQMDDSLERTTDYSLMALRIAEESAARPRKLIETLAVELAGMLVREFPLQSIRVLVRKMALPNAEWVSATHTSRRTLTVCQ